MILLIQLGGLGIMTFSTMVLWRLDARSHSTTAFWFRATPGRPAISGPDQKRFPADGLHRGPGSSFYPSIPPGDLTKALFSGFFHSISAFCNAGFPSSTIISWGLEDVPVSLTVAGLIILGGLGFLVVEVRPGRGQFSQDAKMRLSLHSKMVLITTAALIVVTFFIFLALENNGALGCLPWKEKVLASFFQVVTPRTAGFNTIDLTALGTAAVLLQIFLMFIGASPGSTGGGVKYFQGHPGFHRSRSAARDSVHCLPDDPQNNVVRPSVISLYEPDFPGRLCHLVSQPGMLMKVFRVFSGWLVAPGNHPELNSVNKS
jgi:trk system potassium uptake protein TrkH